MTDSKSTLERVYSAKSSQELVDAYAQWASDYDRETIEMGLCLPFMITAWVARYVQRAAGPILDAGCGTGLSGPYLAALGYEEIEGLDSSPDMLALAEKRACYTSLKKAELGKELPWDDDHFLAFLSTGVFTAGHAPASSFHELVRITRPGGHAIFTVRDVVLDDEGFRDVFIDLEHQGIWRPVEESPPFRPFVLAEPDVLCKAFVFEIL